MTRFLIAGKRHLLGKCRDRCLIEYGRVWPAGLKVLPRCQHPRHEHHYGALRLDREGCGAWSLCNGVGKRSIPGGAGLAIGTHGEDAGWPRKAIRWAFPPGKNAARAHWHGSVKAWISLRISIPSWTESGAS